MTKVQEYIDQAFKYVSAITVSGDQGEIMARARELLRMAYAEAGKGAAEVKEDGECTKGDYRLAGSLRHGGR